MLGRFIFEILIFFPWLLTKIWAWVSQPLTPPAGFLTLVEEMGKVLHLFDWMCPVATPCSTQFVNFVLAMIDVIIWALIFKGILLVFNRKTTP